MLDLYTRENIIIGGVRRGIATYYDLKKLVPVDSKTGYGGLSTNQYISLLFNNLGYNKRPKDLTWLENEVPVENVPKTDPLVEVYSPYTVLKVEPTGMKLSELFACIHNWSRIQNEEGYCIDPQESYKLPPNNEILYDIEHQIMIKKTLKIAEQKYHWNLADFLTRRLHNLCPHINKEYFYRSMGDFDKYIDFMEIKHPISIFVCSIVNPNIIMTIIRESEIKAAKITAKRYHG